MVSVPNQQSAPDRPTVLVVDDQFRSFQVLQRLIAQETFNVIWSPDARHGLEILRNQDTRVRIVIIDLKSSEMGGGGFFQYARHLAPQAAILITGPLGPFLYQRGNFYDCWGFGLKHHINEVLAGIEQKQQQRPKSSRSVSKRMARKSCLGAIIGCSDGINAIYQLIEKLKTSSSTVLIQGESGTGKELVAQTIHQTSTRRDRPFVAINCGAIPASLMESELFGHERGAFTTAINQRKGKFEVAAGGTLFLDEIGEMEKDLQVKLLRVLQEKEFQRVGGNRTYATDVRIIAATSQNLKQAAEQGHFREDLFFRLNVVPIFIPPLMDRREDIALLLNHFWTRAARHQTSSSPLLTHAARQALYAYDYPGNVRELINIVERLSITCPKGPVDVDDLPEEIGTPVPSSFRAGIDIPSVLNAIPPGGVRLADVEKELIIKTLEAAGDNKTEAARMLGITRRRLYLRLSEYGRL